MEEGNMQLSLAMAQWLHPEARTPSITVVPMVAGGAPGSPSPPCDPTPQNPFPTGSYMDGNPRESSASGDIRTGRARLSNKICRVCGDKALSINFNVSTCESCKAFFRWNAYKKNKLRCPFNEACDIQIFSRRFCQRCRLFKCFEVGMKKELIMTVEERLHKNAKVEENRKRRKEAARLKNDDGILHKCGILSVISVDVGSEDADAPTGAVTTVAEETSLAIQQRQLAELSTPVTAFQCLLIGSIAQMEHQQQPQLRLSATLGALVATSPPLLTNSQLIEHAIALEQQAQHYAAAAAAAAAIAQQIVSMITASKLGDVTLADALVQSPTALNAAPIVRVAEAINGVCPQMDTVPPSTPPLAQQHLEQQLEVAPALPGSCCCTCKCEKYPIGSTIMNQNKQQLVMRDVFPELSELNEYLCYPHVPRMQLSFGLEPMFDRCKTLTTFVPSPYATPTTSSSVF